MGFAPVERWTAERKEAFLRAIDGGQEVPAANPPTAEELEDWRQRLASHGRTGLKATYLQRTRP